MSESQLFYVFRLVRLTDRKKVSDFIPDFDELPTAARHHFYFYRDGDDQPPKLMNPVPVADADKLTYTDHLHETEAAESDSSGDDAQSGSKPHVWL